MALMGITLDQALQKGIEAHKAGNAQEAERYYTAILKANPKHPDTNHNMGILAVGVGKVNQALPFFKTALEANPNIAQFWISYLDTLIKLDLINDARAVLKSAKQQDVKGDGLDNIEKKLDELMFLVRNDESKKLQRQDPPHIELQSLITLYTEGHYQEALNVASNLLLEFPSSATLFNIIGAVNQGLGNLIEAEEAFKKSISIMPDYIDAHNNIGLTLKHQGKLQEAIEAFNTAILLKPNYAEAYNNKGIALKEQGKSENAIKAYNKAITIKPDYAEAHNNLGIALKDQGYFEEALEVFEKAISIRPKYADAHNNKGVTLKDLGKLDQAIVAFNRALSVKPNYSNAHYNIGNTLREQGQLHEAIAAYKEALLLKPDYVDAYNNAGVAFKDNGELEMALEAYKKALSIKPNFAEAYNNMGVALREQGEMEMALEAYKKALSIEPDYVEAHNNMGFALQSQGKLDEALEAYNKALLLKSDFAEAYNNMGITLKEKGEPAMALEAYNKALSLKPDFAEAHNNVGITLQDQGNLEEAKEAYRKALILKPYFAEAHRHLSAIKKYTINDPHFIQVKDMYKKQGLDEVSKGNLSFALAKMHEDIGEFDSAFKYLSEGNALRKKFINYSIDQDKNRFKAFKRTQQNLLAKSLKINENSINLKPIFILGMPRSGTSLVEQIISSHSKVTGAGELKYISKYGFKLSAGVSSANTKTVREFREKYLFELSKISHCNDFVTDKMPQNFCFIPLICAAFPEAKIIHIRRDPRATCWSNYKQYFVSKDLLYCYDLQDVVAYYKLYSDLMKFWDSEYCNRIYNLSYEKLTINQEKETKKLIKHLGIEWEKACLSPHKNRRSVKTASQQQVRQKIYQGSSNAWRKYEPFLDGAFDTLPA